MCRNNNKVYCTVGQSLHSVRFGPSRAKRADELESQNRGECFRSGVGKLWQRFSTLIVIVTAWCRAAAAFVAFMQLTFLFSMNYGLFAKSALAPSPKPLAG